MQTVAIVGSILVSFVGAVFGLYQARKADRSATTTKTIELGVKDLVDQYREANEELRDQTHELTERCKALEKTVKDLKIKVDHLETSVDNKDAEIIGLRNRLGETRA